MSIRFKRSDTVLTAELGESVLMMNSDTASYHDINGTGARIWELLAEPRTEAELVSALVSRFDVSRETCASEVATFIGMLRKRQLILDMDAGAPCG